MAPQVTPHTLQHDRIKTKLRNNSLFWSQEMEIAIVGIQNAGKSTYVQVLDVRINLHRCGFTCMKTLTMLLQSGEFQHGLLPTVGFNMHKVRSNETFQLPVLT